MKKKSPDRYHVPALVRGLAILEFLAQRPNGCGLPEIAAGTKLPKNAVFRIATTLAAHGYLARDQATQKYRLDRKLLRLGYAAVDETNLVGKALDVLRDLRDATGETALIAVMAGREGVVIEQVPSQRPIRVQIEIGHHFPMHSAAPGKALLAYLPAAEQAAVLAALPLPRFTARTLTSRAALEQELAQVRRCGYAVEREEEISGVTCIGAPVLNQRGQPVAAIWVTGPSSRLPANQFAKIGPMVRDQAARISQRFGWELLRVASVKRRTG